MGRTACTEPQCLYKGALYLTSVPVQGCTLPYLVPVQGCTLPYLSACTRVHFTLPSACTRVHFTLPQCLYKGAIYFFSVINVLHMMGEKGPYTKQCEIVTNLIRLLTSWLHFQWIRMCTLMLDITADEPPCPL